MQDALARLLLEVREHGASSPAFVALGRMVALDARVPPELHHVFADPEDAAESAGLLLVLLGFEEDNLGAALAGALRAEAGEFSEEVASSEPSEGEWAAALAEPFPVPVAEAVRAEAGRAEVAEVVMFAVNPAWASALLDNAVPVAARRWATAALQASPETREALLAWAGLGRALRGAVVAEAGVVQGVWAGVGAAIGAQAEPETLPWPVREALQHAAGRVDVADAVMAVVRRSAVAPAQSVPVAANSGWAWGGLALAAAAVLMVVVGGPASERPAPGAQALHFAQAGEIVVEDLSYAENASVQVIQNGAEDEPLIIWVQEEVTL